MRKITEFAEEQQGKRRFAVVIAVPVILFLLLTGYGLYRFVRNRSTPAPITTGEITLGAETDAPLTDEEEIIKAVESVMVLPAEEDPTVAVVSDVEKLRDQIFFAAAQNGDVVLVYNQAKKAILYRPDSKQIVEIAPLEGTNENAPVEPATSPSETLPVSTNTPTPTKAVSQALSVVVRNGTTISGAARRYGDTVEDTASNVTVTNLGNAATQNHAKTYIAILNTDKKDSIEALADALGIVVSDLPSSEPKPSADAVIILGADKAE